MKDGECDFILEKVQEDLSVAAQVTHSQDTMNEHEKKKSPVAQILRTINLMTTSIETTVKISQLPLESESEKNESIRNGANPKNEEKNSAKASGVNRKLRQA